MHSCLNYIAWFLLALFRSLCSILYTGTSVTFKKKSCRNLLLPCSKFSNNDSPWTWSQIQILYKTLRDLTLLPLPTHLFVPSFFLMPLPLRPLFCSSRMSSSSHHRGFVHAVPSAGNIPPQVSAGFIPSHQVSAQVSLREPFLDHHMQSSCILHHTLFQPRVLMSL